MVFSDFQIFRILYFNSNSNKINGIPHPKQIHNTPRPVSDSLDHLSNPKVRMRAIQVVTNLRCPTSGKRVASLFYVLAKNLQSTRV